MIDRRSFLSSSALLLMGAALPQLSAAAMPTGGRLVFGVPLGGARGSIGHSLANGALSLLAQQFSLNYKMDVVDARNTLQASETVKLAPADGSTLLQTQSGSMVLFPSMYKTLNYDPVRDFTPLAMLGDYSYAFSVGPAVPKTVTNIDQYMAWVGQNPDFRDVGFSLYGSHGHLIALMLARGKEVAIRPQSYKSAGAIISDLKSQTLAAAITVAGNVSLLSDGIARPLAVSGNSRLTAWPDVPTFKEQGLKDIVIEGWYGWFAPSHVPVASTQELSQKINAMLTTQQFMDIQKKLQITPQIMTSDQIRDRIQTEIASNRKLVQSYNLSQIA